MTSDKSWEKALRCAQSALDKKAYDLVILEVSAVTSVADYFVICTGRSDVQVQSLCRAIEESLATVGVKPLAIEGFTHGQWVLIDFGDVVVSYRGRAVGSSEAALAARTVLHPGPAPQDSDRIAAATTEGCHYYCVCPKTVRRGVAWMERSEIQESARQRKEPETEMERSGLCLCLISLSRVSISHPLGQAYGSIQHTQRFL